MSTLGKIVAGIGVVFVLAFVISISSVIGINNTCVKQEQDITAQHAQDRNVYDSVFKRIKETAQVPGMYADDYQKITVAAIQGRYGANGSKAVFQFIKEHNPTIDASLYKQVQQVIESGHLDFQAQQTMLLDKKRVYQTYIGTFPTGVVAKTLGFPRIDLSKFDIVTSEETETAFVSKKSEPLKLR